MTAPIVVKCGGAVAAGAAELILELASLEPVVVVHGAGPQISAEMERRGLRGAVPRRRRVTSKPALEVVRESMLEVNAALCAAIGDLALPLYGDESACARSRCRCSAWSAIRCRRAGAGRSRARRRPDPRDRAARGRTAERERGRDGRRARGRARGRTDPLRVRRAGPARRRRRRSGDRRGRGGQAARRRRVPGRNHPEAPRGDHRGADGRPCRDRRTQVVAA